MSAAVIKALALQARVLQFQTQVQVLLQDPALETRKRFSEIHKAQGRIGQYCRELEVLAQQQEEQEQNGAEYPGVYRQPGQAQDESVSVHGQRRPQ